ncbi:MAG: hypothetical protein M1819_003328 [Sarea resinae]|nr:MAG: hypothetical protein M1819_003328 [Sarea resinae]
MDFAYDHIQEETLTPDEAAKRQDERAEQSDLGAEFQEAYKAISSSPWGMKLGGLWNNVQKQSETYIEGARQEYSAASEQATKGFTDLRSTIINRTRSLSLNQSPESSTAAAASSETSREAGEAGPSTEGSTSGVLHDAEGILSRFKLEAAKRLKEIEKAEDAADEALLRFGSNVRNFLRDAVSIAPPSDEETHEGKAAEVLFESKDSEGKRVIHTTRFDAQLHAIHSTLDSFIKDAASPEYEKWKEDFSIEKKTEDIASDLDKYQDLRRAFEKLVPEKVEYADFWRRYYYLRYVIETEEQRRKELLKGAAANPDEEEIAWDEDSDSDIERTTPQQATTISSHPTSITNPTASTTTLRATASSQSPTPASDTLHPTAHRRSNDHSSQPDSDASYDVVSGATSRAPGSPTAKAEAGKVAEESDEEDWE